MRLPRWRQVSGSTNQVRPAFRGGLHCGADRARHNRRGHGVGSSRPTGRAPLRQLVQPVQNRPLPGSSRPPGRAPLRLVDDVQDRRGLPAVPPALRGGLHCGHDHDFRAGAGIKVPPALRGGLHCGADRARHNRRGHGVGSPRPPGRAPLRHFRRRCALICAAAVFRGAPAAFTAVPLSTITHYLICSNVCSHNGLGQPVTSVGQPAQASRRQEQSGQQQVHRGAGGPYSRADGDGGLL